MRKLIESTLVSLDGVIESPERWAIFDDEAVQYSMAELANCAAFVMGRVTYERLRANWAAVSANPYIERINASLTDVSWNATLLGPDVVGELERLKAEPGKDLVKYGTGRLDDTLLRFGLVDELRLWFVPAVVGGGQRLFEGVDTSSLDLKLTELRKLDNGSVIATYVPSCESACTA